MKLGVADSLVECGLLWRMLVVLLLLACSANVHATLREANATVEDVLAALHRIPEAPRAVPCQAGGLRVPDGGHLQGIQQAEIERRPFIVMSGSASAESYLVLLALERSGAQVAALKPLLPRPFKHAGGLQVCGDYLAVGIEDDDRKVVSKVWILRLPELLRAGPLEPAIEIERHGAYERATAGAVALARVGDRHVLCVGTWDSATIDFYRSNGKALSDSDCRFELRESWDAKKADRSSWSDGDYASYQNLNLVVERSDRVFLIGFANAGGADAADVFHVALEAAVPVERRLQKVHRCALRGREASFRHGAGLTVVDTETLAILSCGYREFVIERFGPVHP